jgi:hypothetical protein
MQQEGLQPTHHFCGCAEFMCQFNFAWRGQMCS